MPISLLGPLAVDGARQLPPRDRVVLAALAVRLGDVISPEQLADALWGDKPPASWPKVVQGCVARLRQALGRAAVETTSAGYRLTVDADEVDLRRFESLVGRGRRLAEDGEHGRAAAVLAQSLALWRGPALSDLDGWAEGRTEATRLDELRLTAHELLLVERAASGEDVVAEAAALVEADPLRETRWHALALALYRAGRQSDALAALRRARRTLLDELGLDPGQPLVDLEQAILMHDAALAAPDRASTAPSVTCPYQGLLVYDRGDADRFFGRSDDAAACLRLLRAGAFLVVAGPSGSGKSSLVRAGVAPRLERSGAQVAVVTPGLRPLAALAAALSTAARDLVVVVDQLEELFTGGQPAELVREFLDTAAGAVGPHRSLVLVVRADQLGGLTASPAVARLTETALHLVTAMTRDELTEAIIAPARLAGLRLEPGLVDLLVREVEGEPGALPLLNHALAETWERREAGVLTVDGYHRTGGIAGAVAQSAEQLWDSLPEGRRTEMRALLLRLVSISPEGEVAASRLSLATVADDPARRELVDLLARCRLLTTDTRTVTLAHESLARAWPRLRSWLDDDVSGQQLLRHLSVSADDWAARDRPDSELYRGPRLAGALAWRRSGPTLSSLEAEFLDASEALARAEQDAVRARQRARVRQNRRLRLALAGTGLALVLALIAGLVAVQQGRESTRTARTALVERLVAQSVSLRSTQRDLAALLAVEAYRLRPSAATRGALLGVVTAAPGFLGYLPTEVPMTSGAFLPHGRSLLGVGRDGVVRVVETGTGRTTRTFPAPALPPTDALAALSADAGTAAAVSWEGEERGGGRSTLSVYDVPSATRRAVAERLPLDPGAVAVSPDGRYVAVSGYTDGRTLVFDTAGRSTLPDLLSVDDQAAGVRQVAPLGPTPGFTGRRHTAGLAFTSDGLLVVGSQVGTVRLVDPATGSVRRRLVGAAPLTSNNLVAVSADGGVLVTTGTRAVVRWDLGTGRPAWTVDLTEDRCRSVAIVRRTGTVLCGGRFARVVSLALDNGIETGATYDFQRGEVSGLALAPDGSTLVEIGRTEPVLATWHLDGTGPLTRLLPAHGTPAAYNTDGSLLLLSGPARFTARSGEERPVQVVVDARTGSEVTRFGPNELSAVWTSPTAVVAWTDEGQPNLVDVRTHQQLGRLDGGFGEPAAGAGLSADGRHVVAWGYTFFGSSRLTWEVWNMRTGQTEGAKTTFAGALGSLSRHGRLLTWAGSGVVTTYAVASGRVLAERRGDAMAAASPTGPIGIASATGRLSFFRQKDLTPIGAPVAGSVGRVQQLAFSHDGSLLAVHGGDSGVRLVDVPAGVTLGEPIDLGGDHSRTIALRPDGRELAVPHPDGVLVWDLHARAALRAACTVAGRALSDDEVADYLAGVDGAGTGCSG